MYRPDDYTDTWSEESIKHKSYKGGEMKVFYHSSDLDGHCSGAIVSLMHPECELIGINYGDDFPWDSIKEKEIVFMVDFSLQPFEDMERLNHISKLTWIDHHKTAINQAYDRGFLANQQVLETNKAACELVWDFFHPGVHNEAVRLLGRYDVWDLQTGTLELQSGLRMHNTFPENRELWTRLLEGDVSFLEETLQTGKILLQKKEIDDKIYAQACAFETELDGLRCIALNRGLTNSKILDSVYDPEIHDAMLIFVWRKSKWTVSLYSDQPQVDVSKICKKRGGGGHDNAAGFQCKKLPFDLK